MARRPTLAELIQESTRRLDLSGWRQQIDKTLQMDHRDGAAVCDLASMPLLSMFDRLGAIKEGIEAAGGDWYEIEDDYDNPKHRALTDAYRKAIDDSAASWSQWKKACMRRAPGRD
jgi:hypothetical protein